MKKKVKKPLSRLDKQGLEVAAQSKAIVDTGHRITRLECRVDKVDSSLARELFAIREAFQLTDEWRNRALKAESTLAQTPPPVDAAAVNTLINEWSARAVAAEGSLKYAQDTLDKFKREDEAWALAIREIVRPLGFDLFAPMDAVREMAKLTFSLRDELASLRAKQAKEQAEKDAYIKSRLDDSAAQEVESYCVCVRFPREGPVAAYDPETETPVDRRWYGHVVLAQKGCRHCGGTGYRRKDSPGPLPPDAARSVPEKVQEYIDRMKASIRFRNAGWITLSDGTMMQDFPEVDPEVWKQGTEPRRKEVKEKPLRLLVEIVDKKDESHGTRLQRFSRDGGLTLEISREQQYTYGPAMSIKELPEIPSIRELVGIWCAAKTKKDEGADADNCRAVRAVLAACGLEVAE